MKSRINTLQSGKDLRGIVQASDNLKRSRGVSGLAYRLFPFTIVSMAPFFLLRSPGFTVIYRLVLVRTLLPIRR
jgi:hypothetical protein